MPTYSFYFDKKDSQLTVELTEDEEKHRRQDWETAQSSKSYRKRFEADGLRGARIFNVIQEGTSDDSISNFTLGLARMITETGISMMTEGQPDFDFAPLGPSDNKKIILWKSLIKMLLSRCNYLSHQEKFITDFHVFGTGVFEVYTQLPYRTKRSEVGGKIEEKIVRDFRRTKVGVRHVSPWSCWRNPNVSDPDDVPTSGMEEIMTYNQFIQNYANVYVIGEDGNPKPKYKNIEQLGKGTHVKVTPIHDEIQDAFRKYAIAYGTEVDGYSTTPPEDFGIPIFDKPLSITRDKGHSSGANVQGMSPLCFGVNNSQYDSNFKTHALYGMGIPQLIEGPDDILTTLFNMDIDNARLANTPLISYQPFDGKSYLGSDFGPRYAGDFVDGKIDVQYMAQSRFGDNSMRYEFINNLCIWLTGINFQQLGGDSSKTAFEFAQRIRANNQRAEKRIRTLENGCLKRMATLLLSSALSELTVDEWEELTEDQVKSVAKRIEDNEATAEDYDLTEKKRRVMMYIPVEGRKFVEDFKSDGQPKKRQLDGAKTNNTLIEDKSLSGDVCYVPLVGEYVYPTEYIESGLLPDVIVDGKRMLGDLKVQDMEVAEKGFRLGMEIAALDPELQQDLDFKKQYTEIMKIGGMDENKLFKSQDKGSAVAENLKKLEEEVLMLSSPQPSNAPTAQPTTALPAPQAPQPAPSVPGPGLGPPAALGAAAAGTL